LPCWCVLLALALIEAGANDPCILPVGNSITQGDKSHASYRYPLWKMMMDNDINYTWTGSMNGPWPPADGSYPGLSPTSFQPPYKSRSFPTAHEGHWGWTVDQVLTELQAHWMPSYTCSPSCILVHLGTNDVAQGQSLSSTVAELRSLIQVFQAAYPNSTTLLATPIPTCSAATYTILAPAIRKMGNASGRVFVVDMEPGFNGLNSDSSDVYDGCHPNAAGEFKMATKWFAAITAHCNSTITAPPPLVSAAAAPAAGIPVKTFAMVCCFVWSLFS